MKVNIQTAAIVCLFCAVGFSACKSAPKEEAAPAETASSQTAPAETTVKEETPAVAPVVDYADANTKLLEAAESARQEAAAASASELYADSYSAVEKQFDQLKNDCTANPSTDYSAQIKDVTSRYQALANAAKAQALKKRIDELDLSSYDKQSYDDGETALAEYAKLGSSAASGDQLAQADKAYNSYLTVLTKAFKALAGNERRAALEAKKNADSVKAGVAKKDEYTAAADTFKKADSSFVTQDIEAAYKGYQESKNSFAVLYDSVSKARAAAQEAIDNARKAAESTKSYASEADTIAPLGDGEVKGIEAEDKKMLEDDTLSNPDDAVIDVDSGATAKAVQEEAAVLENTDSAATDASASAAASVQEAK